MTEPQPLIKARIYPMKQAAAGTTGFTTSQEVRISRAIRNRSVNGGAFDRLKKVNDLIGDWDGADPTKCYAGIVPVVGGVDRYDLALTPYDLCTASVIDFPENADKGKDFNLDCPARKIVTEEVAKPGCKYDTLIDAVVAAFPNGGKFKAIEYTTRTKKGGTWRNALLSFEK